MSFGSDDVQTPDLADMLLFLHKLAKQFCLRPIDSDRLLVGALERLEPLLEVQGSRIGDPCPPQNAIDRGKYFLGDFAAQFDVDPSSSHVGSNGHRSKRTRAGDNARFFRMFLCVQYIVADTAR